MSRYLLLIVSSFLLFTNFLFAGGRFSQPCSLCFPDASYIEQRFDSVVFNPKDTIQIEKIALDTMQNGHNPIDTISDFHLDLDSTFTTPPQDKVVPVITKKDKIKNRNILQTLSFPEKSRVNSWNFNPTYMSIEKQDIDTSLWMTHLFYPQQEYLETYTFLGNLGSPTKYDHFFSNDHFTPFLFTRYHRVYAIEGLSLPYFNVRKPFTILTYSTAGKRKTAEQILRVIHTQNIDPYLNFGVVYNFLGTKGVYSHQETRNTSFALFSTYNRGNLSFQTSLVNNVFRNDENGGLVDDYFIQDTIVEQPNLIPFRLASNTQAKSEMRERNISAILGYTLINYESKKYDEKGRSTSAYMPLITAKAIVNGVRNTRMYTDIIPSDEFYSNFFINPNKTYDTVFHSTWDFSFLLESEQIAKYPGVPGFRVWYSNQQMSYYYYKPGDFIFNREDDQLHTDHLGVASYSFNDHFSYQGSARFYINGYKADDKELTGEISFSPFSDKGMPTLFGKLKLVEKTPDIFLQNYFSNHFYWNNEFLKERWFWLAGSIKTEKWKTDIGYNLMHINNYIYFDTTAIPKQTSRITVTSAYIQKGIDFKGFNFVNKIVWQVANNNEVISLPRFIFFSSLYYENYLVKNVLKAQFGVSGFYRTKFYAEAYSPATGQFYNQTEKKIGGYPTIDLFANFKWKRALIYFKYEHLNQGFPTQEYFATLHYPINPRIFKFGVSWMFYD